MANLSKGINSGKYMETLHTNHTLTLFQYAEALEYQTFHVSDSYQAYRNVPKFSDRWACESVDPERSSLIRVYTVCHSVCIFWTHYSW